MLRRLHQDQPESFAVTPADRAWAEGQTEEHPEGRQALAVVPLLWRSLVALAVCAGSGTALGASAVTRDHDELPRVVACQEKLAAAAEALRAAMPGYDLVLDLKAAERIERHGDGVPVTCSIRIVDNVPALRALQKKH